MVSDDRAQLMLTTAVILAMIVLGVAVLLTAASTTEVRAPDDPTTDGIEAERIAADIERGSAGLAASVNGADRHASAAALAAELAAAFEPYEASLYESIGDRRATSIDLEAGAIDQLGAYLADPDLETPPSFGDEGLGVDGDATMPMAAVRFALDADSLGSSPTSSIQLRFVGEDRVTTVAIYRDGETTRLETSTDDRGDESIAFDGEAFACGQSATVDVDLSRHGADGADCQFDPFASIEPVEGDEYGLVVENDAGVTGGYHLAVGEEPTAFAATHALVDTAGEDEPYAAYLAWSIELELSQWSRAGERHAQTSVVAATHPHAATVLEVPWP